MFRDFVVSKVVVPPLQSNLWSGLEIKCRCDLLNSLGVYDYTVGG
jgi:hypothetical protein